MHFILIVILNFFALLVFASNLFSFFSFFRSWVQGTFHNSQEEHSSGRVSYPPGREKAPIVEGNERY